MTGPAVAVAVAVPRLELDRPFTYLLPEGSDAGTGTLVSVPFHGRTVKGWVLGPTDDVPDRVLPVRRVLSRVPLFDDRALRLYRWVSERFVVPLSTVIDRAHPPRVAGEEGRESPPPVDPPSRIPVGPLAGYGGGAELIEACRRGSGAFVARPLPDDEGAVCVEAVAACLDGGRDAIVIVPEVGSATGDAVLEAFGDAAVLFAGGDARARYRTFLDIRAGRYRVVVGTRPAVFAPVPRPGLAWVHRDAHPAHREERAPYYHVRDVALARARLEEAGVVLAGQCPSGVAAAMADEGTARLVRAPRRREREAAPIVETARPDREERSRRLGAALRAARGAFLLVSRRGYGTARVCRQCGEPARCAACSGPVVLRSGVPRCAVCGTEAICPVCGSRRFGIERGGIERVEEWARSVTELPVRRIEEGQDAIPPGTGGVVVGTAAAVKDFGPRRVDLVAILDPDRARRRAGLLAGEQSLAVWMESAAWAGPRAGGGRVLVHTNEAGEPAIQALVRWDPWHFHRAERDRREEAGFPPGFPVFRVLGDGSLAGELATLDPVAVLESSSDGGTVCLVTLRPDAVPAFRSLVLKLVTEGRVSRIEAEPQL